MQPPTFATFRTPAAPSRRLCGDILEARDGSLRNHLAAVGLVAGALHGQVPREGHIARIPKSGRSEE